LVRWQDRLFVFLVEPEASPTNNGSEQALRWSAVVTAQVVGGSRSPEVCDQTLWVGVQGLQDIPPLLPGC